MFRRLGVNYCEVLKLIARATDRENQRYRHSSATSPTHFTHRHCSELLRQIVIKCPELQGYLNASAGGSRLAIIRGDRSIGGWSRLNERKKKEGRSDREEKKTLTVSERLNARVNSRLLRFPRSFISFMTDKLSIFTIFERSFLKVVPWLVFLSASR